MTSLDGSTFLAAAWLQRTGPAVGRRENLAASGPVYVQAESWGRVPGSMGEFAAREYLYIHRSETLNNNVKMS